MTTNEEIDTIRKKANIVDIISSYIPLTSKGKNYFGVCPFHEDHSPSMSVSLDKQIYKCFSCGAAGNVFTFVSEYENVSFLEAVKIVAEKCGLSFFGTNSQKEITHNKEEYELMNLALKFYQNNLNSEAGRKAKEYLQERKLDGEVISDFDIGLALDGTASLNKLLANKTKAIATLKTLGLVNENNGYINDVFQKRIMFPIHDLQGNVVGFTGRIYEDNNQAKYINSRESTIFKKGTILFNYHRAKKEIKRLKEVIIVEGNMDAIRMYASGIKNVVALMGTSITSEQVKIIKNLRVKVILMLDSDEAGQMATYQNGIILEKENISPLVIRLTNSKDPDEYILKNGVDALNNNLKRPLTFLEFKIQYFKRNLDLTKVDDLATYVKLIINDLREGSDDITTELTLKKISAEYDISFDLLNSELKRSQNKKQVVSSKPKLLKPKLTKYDRVCQGILYFMMNDERYIIAFKKELGFFSEKKYRILANEIMYYYELNKEIQLSDFISFISTKDYIYDDAMAIIKNNNLGELNSAGFNEFVAIAKKEMAKKEIDELKVRLANSMDVNEKMELASKILNLKKDV